METQTGVNHSSLLPNLQRTPRPLQRRTRIIVMGFGTIDEIIPPDARAFAHASENAALVVKVDGGVEFRHIARVHDQDSIVPNLGALANDPSFGV